MRALCSRSSLRTLLASPPEVDSSDMTRSRGRGWAPVAGAPRIDITSSIRLGPRSNGCNGWDVTVT